MKNLCYMCFLLIGIIIPETGLRAQESNRLLRLESSLPENREPRFIEGIEITGSPVKVQTTQMGSTSVPFVVTAPSPAPASPVSIEHCHSLQFKYALLMNRNVESLSNLALYRFIDDWWGTRYRYGGQTRKGIDCSAFTGKLYADVYQQHLPRTAREQFQSSQAIKLDELQEGDLVFFNTRGGVSHVGVYLGEHYFVHSSTNDGVTISSLLDDYYRNRFIAGGRMSANIPSDACVPGQPECQD